MSGQMSLAASLVSAFEAKHLTAYSSLLADGVKVFEDGDLVAGNRPDWLKRFGPKFSAKGVSFKLAPGYASTGRFLFIEYFNSLASWGQTPPPDFCWGYKAVAYDVANGKMHTTRRLKGGTIRLGEDDARPAR